MRLSKILCCVLAITMMSACTELGPGWNADRPNPFFDPDKADSGIEAVFLDFEFDGELLVDFTFRPKETIETQLMYTVGQLNGEDSVGRLDLVDPTNIETETTEDGKTRISYHVVLTVAWNKKNTERENYTFVLPHDVSSSAKATFYNKYKHCTEDDDPVENTFWYYYRPRKQGCDLDEKDIIRLPASMSPSDLSTTGKYPEYHKIFEDDALRVVAIFGKNEKYATSEDDYGIKCYNNFADKIRGLLTQTGLETTPAEVPEKPGVDETDIEWRTALPNGDQVIVNTLLIDSVSSAGYQFNQRYAELSETADFIIYNGHSGYGANIRSLASRGSWVEGQYVIVWMNGCDTYAYVDSALADAHARVNPDDDVGTKYVDLVMNAMPGYFSDHDDSTIHMIRSLMNRYVPKTYEQIFENIAPRQVVLVSGEDDNEYHPGMLDPDDPEAWQGMQESGLLESGEMVHFQTPRLKAGSYLFEMNGSGDADLYIRVGQTPTRQSWDCRPYSGGSDETCRINLSEENTIYIMIAGYSTHSEYRLVGRIEVPRP